MGRPFEAVKSLLIVTPEAGAAAQTTITSSAVDTAGFTGVQFLVVAGPIESTGVLTFKLQQSDDDGSADAYSDLLDSSQAFTDASDNTIRLSDIIHPRKRYLKLVVTRGTADATVGAVIAQLYGASSLPVTQTASGENYNFPAEGTA